MEKLMGFNGARSGQRLAPPRALTRPRPSTATRLPILREGEMVMVGNTLYIGHCLGRSRGGIQNFEYRGATRRNKANGVGKLYYPGPNLSTTGPLRYEGNFKDNLFSGAGKIFDRQGQCRYDGKFKAQKALNGTILGESGVQLYNGEFDENQCSVGDAKIKFGDGVYTGKVNNWGVPTGEGVFQFASGIRFVGTFDGIRFIGEIFDREGRRRCAGKFNKGRIVYGTVFNEKNVRVGDVRSDESSWFAGNVWFTCDNGLVYYGKLDVFGFPTGIGGVQFASGARLEGTFKNGKILNGTIFDSSGVQVYEGEFDENQCPVGNATIDYGNGSVYRGKVNNRGLPTGGGVRQFAGGAWLAGTFEGAMIIDAEIFDAKGTRRFKGKLKDFKILEGMVFSKLGFPVYEGNFDENQCSVGNAKIKFGDGSVYTGKVNNRGLPTGDGVLQFKNGNRYEGELAPNGKPAGKGIFYFKNGATLKGTFKNGSLFDGTVTDAKGNETKIENGHAVNVTGKKRKRDETKETSVQAESQVEEDDQPQRKKRKRR